MTPDTTLPVPLPELIAKYARDVGIADAIADPNVESGQMLYAFARACMAPLQERADALQAERDKLAEENKWLNAMRETIVPMLRARADALEAALKSAVKHAKKHGMHGWPVFADMERLINPTGGES